MADQYEVRDGRIELVDKPWYDDTAEVSKQVLAGAVVDVPTKTLKTVKTFSPSGSFADRASTKLLNSPTTAAVTKAFAPDYSGRGGVASAMMGIGRQIAPALAPAVLAAGIAPEGAVVGTGAALAGLVSGSSKYQDVLDASLKRGADRKSAETEARRAGVISGAADAAIYGVGGQLGDSALIKAGVSPATINNALKAVTRKGAKVVKSGASFSARLVKELVKSKHTPLIAKLASLPVLGAIGNEAIQEASKRAKTRSDEVKADEAAKKAAMGAGQKVVNADDVKAAAYQRAVIEQQLAMQKPKVTIVQHADDEEYEEDDEE